MTQDIPTALITGGSRGFGRALTEELLDLGWRVVVDARPSAELTELLTRDDHAGRARRLVAIAGDVTDPTHREALTAAVEVLGGVELLVNNASGLGPSPLPSLAQYPLDALEQLVTTNLLAPLALTQLLLPSLRSTQGVAVNVSSDAAVEPYPGWGGYGASKAALDQVSAILGAEEPDVRVYAFDPGDMRTAMHQLAFPGEDISDRPEPLTVVPALLRLVAERPRSGRYRASDLAAQVA